MLQQTIYLWRTTMTVGLTEEMTDWQTSCIKCLSDRHLIAVDTLSGNMTINNKWNWCVVLSGEISYPQTNILLMSCRCVKITTFDCISHHDILTFFVLSSLTELIDRFDKLFNHEIKEFSLDWGPALLHVGLHAVSCSSHGTVTNAFQEELERDLQVIFWHFLSFHWKMITCTTRWVLLRWWWCLRHEVSFQGLPPSPYTCQSPLNDSWVQSSSCFGFGFVSSGHRHQRSPRRAESTQFQWIRTSSWLTGDYYSRFTQLICHLSCPLLSIK